MCSPGCLLGICLCTSICRARSLVESTLLPLDRQSRPTLVLQGLWRGTLAGQLLYVPYTVVQFVTLQQVNLAARRLQLTETRAAPLISYASGAVAGMAATCISYPFDLLRTTLAAQGEPKVGETRAQQPHLSRQTVC